MATPSRALSSDLIGRLELCQKYCMTMAKGIGSGLDSCNKLQTRLPLTNARHSSVLPWGNCSLFSCCPHQILWTHCDLCCRSIRVTHLQRCRVRIYCSAHAQRTKLAAVAAVDAPAKTLRIGTRGSPLAMAQAYLTKKLLQVDDYILWFAYFPRPRAHHHCRLKTFLARSADLAKLV